MRRSRFLAAVESEVDSLPFIRKRSTELPHCQISHKPAVALSPGFNNEKKVEHLAIINEVSIVQSFLYANSNSLDSSIPNHTNSSKNIVLHQIKDRDA